MESATISPRQNVRKKIKCAVEGCESTSHGEVEVRFHNFPVRGKRFVYTKNKFGKLEKTDQLDAWVKASQIKKLNTNSRLCALHFRKDDYILPHIPGKRRNLKTIAVPSCNLPPLKSVDVREARRGRVRRRNLKDTKEVNPKFEVVELSSEQPEDNSSQSSEDIVDPLVTDKQSTSIDSESVTMKKIFTFFYNGEQFLSDIPQKRRCLKTIAVPSCNLSPLGRVDAREARKESRRRNMKDNKEVNRNFEVIELSSGRPKDNSSQSSEDIIDPLVTDKQCTSIGSESVTTKKCGIQVQNNFLKPKLIDFISSDAELSSLTGIESVATFNAIVEIVTKTFGDELEHRSTKMSIRDKVLMCYVKLKQNMTYNCLAILSHCRSGKTCERIFFELIKTLSASLKSVVEWPSRETISKTLPKCFEGFEDVRVILDCTEVSIRQPKNLCCQLTTHSTYKKSQTFKLMTGVTPAGKISYVSKVYGGQTSDEALFGDCDIIHLMEPGDGIMAGTGFTMDEHCISNNWKLYRPPVLKEKWQFTNAEATLTAKMEKARNHIPWSSQRIKTFKIVRETMPSNLIPVIEDIFIVICATLNLSSPILRDDEVVCLFGTDYPIRKLTS